MSDTTIPATLMPVEPLHDDALNRGYRMCDFCFETCCEDLWAGKPWRKFYHSTDGSDLDVCENCVGKFAEESAK